MLNCIALPARRLEAPLSSRRAVGWHAVLPLPNRKGCKPVFPSANVLADRGYDGGGSVTMEYNWDREPTLWERHRKVLIASAIIVAIGLALVWPMV